MSECGASPMIRNGTLLLSTRYRPLRLAFNGYAGVAATSATNAREMSRGNTARSATQPAIHWRRPLGDLNRGTSHRIFRHVRIMHTTF